MSALAPWLGHPKAVSQRLYVADDSDGMYQCKTRSGNLIVRHHNPNNRLLPGTITTYRVYHQSDPEEAAIIELARQDPRHAIASALDISTDRVKPETIAFQPRSISTGPKGTGIRNEVS